MGNRLIACTLMMWAMRLGMTPAQGKAVGELFEQLVGMGLDAITAGELVVLSVEG